MVVYWSCANTEEVSGSRSVLVSSSEGAVPFTSPEGSGRMVIDGEEVYEFDLEEGVYYLIVTTGYPVRWAGDDGSVVDFHSWGAVVDRKWSFTAWELFAH